MNKALKIIAIALLAVAVVLGAFAFWQRDNINAAIMGLVSDPAALQEELHKQQEELQATIDTYAPDTVRDLTDEEKTALQNGEITVEEAAQMIVTSNTAKSDPNSTSGAGAAAATSTDGSAAKQAEIIGKYIGQLYAYKAYYLGKLGGITTSVAAEFDALPQEEKTTSRKQSMILARLGEIADLEDECDAKVASIISEMRTELTAAGLSTDIISTVEKTYQDEKAAQKAYYLSEYNS